MSDLTKTIDDLTLDELNEKIAELEAKLKETTVQTYFGHGKHALQTAVLQGIECDLWVGRNKYRIKKCKGFTEAVIIERKLKSEAKANPKHDTKYSNVYEYLAVYSSPNNTKHK